MRRGWKRVDSRFEESSFLQFGGASGTLAALGDRALPVSQALAAELDLRLPDAPWHAHRDRLAALVCACGVHTGSLAKMARDISLMMQHETAEAAEPGGDGRGGSSTMPHKRNPIACALALAAATRVPGQVAAFLAGMPQEHERAAGGWQAEWVAIARVVEDTGLALASMREAAEGLTVNAARMRRNLESTGGAIFAERAALLLAEKLGREDALRVVDESLRRSAETGRPFTAVLAEMPEARAVLTPAQIGALDDPRQYLGAAEVFRQQLLEE